ncbi:single-stranded DNA-binding protein [bacterium]|nr:single-stranded DNA-binding protein [candidate division CSSED10-310 bacterium]
MLNLVVLIGNLGADPDIRTTPSGIKVAKMRLAVNDIWTNRSSGEKEKKTHWIDLTAWDRQAQTAERFLTRGQRIAVRGSLEYREWTGQDGAKRSKLEVRVKELIMLSSKDQAAGGSTYPRSGGPDSYSDNVSKPASSAPRSPSPRSQNGNDQAEPYTPYASDEEPFEDDDIPF